MHRNNFSHIQWPRVLVILVINLIAGAFLYWNIIVLSENLLRQAEASYMREQLHKMESSLLELTEECQSLSTSIARDSSVQKAFISADRSRINTLMLPAYSKWQDKYRVNQMRLISSKGIGVWDINSPMGSGNDFSYRRIIQHTINKKEKQAAIESSEETNSIVSTVPIFSGDNFLGLCELGLSLESALGGKIKTKGPDNYAIFKLDGIRSSLLWENKASRLVLNTADIEKVQQGQAFYRPSEDKKIMLEVIPLQDIDGITIGYIQGEISRQVFFHARQHNYLCLIIIMVFILLTSVYILYGVGIQLTPHDRELVNIMENGKISRLRFDSKEGQSKDSAD